MVMPKPRLACAKTRFMSCAQAFAELEEKIELAVRIYANVHRGTGPHAAACAALHEDARNLALQFWQLDPGRFHVIFGDRKRQARIRQALPPRCELYELHSRDIGLALGVGVLAAPRHALAACAPSMSGGEPALWVSPRRVLWAQPPARFEAGTPNVIGVIALAKALTIIRATGDSGIFKRGRRLLTLSEVIQGPATAVGTDLEHLRGMIMGQAEGVPSRAGEVRHVHLDNSSGTQALKPAWEAWRAGLRVEDSEDANRLLLARARAACHAFFEAPEPEYTCVFTANTTDGVQVAAENLSARFSKEAQQTVVVTTLIEHHANELPWRLLPGVKVLRLPADRWGQPDLECLEQWLREYNDLRRHGRQRIRLVAMSGASNVLGLFTDIARAARLAHAFQAEILVDGAQLAGRRRVRLQAAGVDYFVFSGHMVYAPFGAGVLLAKECCLGLEPARRQEIQISGEENTAGLTALAAAIEALQGAGMEAIESEERKLTAAALERLSRFSGLHVYGVTDPSSRLFANKAGIISFSLRKIPHHLAAALLAELGGIGVRQGSFCSQLIVKWLLGVGWIRSALNHLGLRLLGERLTWMEGLVRVSFGLGTQVRDLDALCGALSQMMAEKIPLPYRIMAWLKRGGLPRPQGTYALMLHAWLQEMRHWIFTGTPFPEPASFCPKKQQGLPDAPRHLQN